MKPKLRRRPTQGSTQPFINPHSNLVCIPILGRTIEVAKLTISNAILLRLLEVPVELESDRLARLEAFQLDGLYQLHDLVALAPDDADNWVLSINEALVIGRLFSLIRDYLKALHEECPTDQTKADFESVRCQVCLLYHMPTTRVDYLNLGANITRYDADLNALQLAHIGFWLSLLTYVLF